MVVIKLGVQICMGTRDENSSLWVEGGEGPLSQITFYDPVTNHDNYLHGNDSISPNTFHFCITKYRIACT